MLPCNAVPQLQVCQSTRAAQTPTLWAFWPCLKLANRSDVPGLPLTPRPLTQEQMRAAAAPAIRAMQAKKEIAPAGRVPRQCDWKHVEASLRKRFQAVPSGTQPFFVAGHHLVILVDGIDAEKPVLKSMLDEWLDPARQSSNLVADERGKAFLDSIDPAYAPVVLQGEPRRIRALRDELEVIAQASNNVAAEMGLVERDDLGRLSREAATEQYRAWLVEGRMAGLAKEGIERLDTLMLRLISVASTLRNELARSEFVQQTLISEYAIENGCTFSVLGGGNGAKDAMPFPMYLRGLVIHASRPLTTPRDIPPVSPASRGRAAISTTGELVAAMRAEHGVEVELLGPNSRRAAPGLGLTGKLLLVSAYGEQDEARLLAQPLAELLRRDSKQDLTILRSPYALPLAGRGSLIYDLADDLDEQVETLTLQSAAALRPVYGFLLKHGMLDLIEESHTGFSVQAARGRIEGMGRGPERERGHKLLNDYEYYEHAAAHLHRRRWRGLFLQMANYLDQPVGKEGLALLPMAAEDAEAVFQFLHDDRELVERLQQKLLVTRLHTAAPAETVQERVELM